MRPAILVALLAARALAQGEALPAGTAIPRVECGAAPGTSYALYLPKAYTPERRWPVLYLLDPRARGMVPLERAVPAAERFGWVVASSNDSQGDGPLDAMTKPFLAMLADTHARLALDDARLTVGGFSAGARTAAFLGQVLKIPPAGVIACGAGFLEERPPTKDVRFSWFGMAGVEDFNYVEMKRLAAELGRLGVRHRLALFDGPHSWGPPEAFTEALAWMEAWEAARAGRAAPELLAEVSAEARAREASPLEALERWEAIARDLRPLGDVGEAERRARELRAALKKEIREDEKRDERDARFMGKLEARIQAAMTGDATTSSGKLLADLGVPDLLERAAKDPSKDERLSAVRLLRALRARLGSYLPMQLKERGDAARAKLSKEAAAVIGEGLAKAGY